MSKALYIGGAAAVAGIGWYAWRHVGLDPDSKPAPIGTPLPAGISAKEVEIEKAAPGHAVGAEDPSAPLLAPPATPVVEPEAVVTFRLGRAAQRVQWLGGYEVQWVQAPVDADLAEVGIIRMKLVPKANGGADKWAAAAATTGWDVGLGGTAEAPELWVQQGTGIPPRGSKRLGSSKRFHRLGGLYKPEANVLPLKGPASVLLIRAAKVPAGLLPQTPAGLQPHLAPAVALPPGAQKAIEAVLVNQGNEKVSGRNAWSGLKGGAMVSGFPRSTITGGFPRSDVVGRREIIGTGGIFRREIIGTGADATVLTQADLEKAANTKAYVWGAVGVGGGFGGAYLLSRYIGSHKVSRFG